MKVTPIDDIAIEGSESVILTLATGSGYVVGAAKTATVTIADNDLPITVSVTATDASASETSVDSGVFTIARVGPLTASLVVYYTLGGTAQNGTDYNLLGNSVTIPAGAASAAVIVKPIDDALTEVSETVTLTLVGTANYDVGAAASATVTIADNTVGVRPFLGVAGSAERL